MIAIQNSNAQIGNIHLNFHMNGICSVANGMISKSFIASKLKGVAQSLLNSQLAKMEVSLVNTINKNNSMVRSILGVCDPAKAASLLSSLFNNPSFGRFLSVKPFIPESIPKANDKDAKCLMKTLGSMVPLVNAVVSPMKPMLIKLVQSKSFRPPSASGFSVGTISFKRVNYRDLQFNNEGSHIDLNIKGLSVTINRINIKIQKTINKFGASFNLNCGGWIEGGISSSNLNSHLYFGKGPVIAIQNSNAQIGNIHLNFHMNGICSVANGMISKSFIASKLKGVAQSLLNSQLAKMEDAISKKINGIPKIKTILGYCGNVMDAFGKNDAKRKMMVVKKGY